MTSNERVAFENWFRESQAWPPNCPLPTRVSPERRYELGYMEFMWKGWNARSSRVETTTPQCIDCLELKNALASAVGIANEAREHHDRDQDMRTMKILLALSGHIPGWRADTDRIHAVLRKAVERSAVKTKPDETGSPLTSDKCEHGIPRRFCTAVHGDQT